MEMHAKCPVSGETLLEERFNHFTHLVGFVISLVGLPILMLYSGTYGDFWHVTSYTIFGITLILLYMASTLYHGSQTIEKKTKFRVIDHACIYLLIAGSYTPFALGPLRDTSGWMLLAIEWTIAGVGILLKIYAFNRFQALSLVAYLVMGWMIVFSWSTLTHIVDPLGITMLISGGISYSLGVIFFLWRSLPFSHGIWHLFVLGGSACHYSAVLLLI